MNSNNQCDNLSQLDQLCINTLRFLAADGVQQANSGHPGLPMGIAPVAYRLFTKHLKHNPENPNWFNRDRFVLSAGHGSMLLYSLLHLTGYDLSMEELKNFRQSGSKTPGHPEYGHTPGVEVTTGPLGQGISNAVGMAIAEKYLSAQFNQPGYDVVDNKVYVIAGDGCLQEGVASEACSLAGHLGLNNLILIYDDNKITIDGDTSLSFTEDVVKRFISYGWDVEEITGDGHDLDSFDQAIEKAQKSDKPTLIKFQTVIGYGSPNKQGKADAHGAPLGDDELALAKETLGWKYEERFFVPEEAKTVFGQCVEKGKKAEAEWSALLEKYVQEFPELGAQFQDALAGKLPKGWEDKVPVFEAGTSMATRSASGAFLNGVMPELPLVLGGSADLSPSNNTRFTGSVSFQKDTPSGRYLHYGVREHAMGAILNGISVYGMLRAYGATFLSFADYMLPSIRVAALSGYPSIFVFTHDSIGLGEDGPTHQPVEHVSYLRSMPGLISFRPADANETAQAWKFALENRDIPVAFSFTRQNLPTMKQAAPPVAKGGYVVIEKESPDVLLIATGSEVSLAVEASEKLAEEGIKAQVVSMPSVELFEQQTQEYKDSVLNPAVKARVAVEAGIKGSWSSLIGDRGEFVGMNSFGSSAPADELFKRFGITTDAVVQAAKKSIAE